MEEELVVSAKLGIGEWAAAVLDGQFIQISGSPRIRQDSVYS